MVDKKLNEDDVVHLAHQSKSLAAVEQLYPMAKIHLCIREHDATRSR